MIPLELRMNHPCAFDWDEMETGNGQRFCNACEKNIIDFTRFSDQQLIDFFNNKPQMICGSFSQKQLNRPIMPFSLNTVLAPLKYASSLLFLFGTSQSVIAKTEFKQFQKFETPDSNIPIKGFILLEGTNKPAPFATITIRLGNKIVSQFKTDADGKYKVGIDTVGLTKLLHVTILSEDQRVQFEETVPVAELLFFFNRAIPFYEKTMDKNSETSPKKSFQKKHNKWNPFRRQPKYTRLGGCPIF